MQLIGFGPTPVENEFAVGVEFQVQRRHSQQPPIVVSTDEVPGYPTGIFTYATMSLQGAEKCMTEKGILLRNEYVPLSCRKCTHAVKAFDAHDSKGLIVEVRWQGSWVAGEPCEFERETWGWFASELLVPFT